MTVGVFKPFFSLNYNIIQMPWALSQNPKISGRRRFKKVS
jgi:hypothetical protein